MGRRRYGRSNGIVDMQLTLPAIVKKPKGRVALLLNFRKNDAGADRVNGAGRHEHNVTRARGMPLHPIDDRAVRDRRSQLGRGKHVLQAEGDLGVRSGRENVPRLGLAVGQADRPREGIVGMDLNG